MKIKLSTLLCLSTFIFLSAIKPLLADEINIAVAANFTGATKKIVPLFEKASGHKVKVSFGSTGKLYAQIINGAPFEVFLAADTKRPVKAEKEGLAVKGSRFVYARGQLVLWSAKDKLYYSGEDFLKKGMFSHLALANPKTAPYGMAAVQVMEHLGVNKKLKGKLVQGDSIAQTFQFVATKNAEIGFIAYSQIKGWKGDSGSVWLIPADYYQPIEQAAVLLKKGETNPAAKAFMQFLHTDPQALKVIKEFGYGIN